MNTDIVAQIRQRLHAALAPAALEVLDEGEQHAGHAHAGQGHFRIRITSAAFAGKTPLACHRMVYAALAGLMEQGIHALAIETAVPLDEPH